jgi:hypothetical protein
LQQSRQSLGSALIGLPLASWSPMTMVKSPMPGACAAALLVGCDSGLWLKRDTLTFPSAIIEQLFRRSPRGDKLEHNMKVNWTLGRGTTSLVVDQYKSPIVAILGQPVLS